MLKHLDEKGVKMVDISEKEEIDRVCVARGFIKLKPSTLELISRGKVRKGDVLTTAQIAGIMAVKNTSNIIPLCHPLPITGVEVKCSIEREGIEVEVKVKTTYKTGVEMEALTGVSAALLTIWDMVKAIEKDEDGQYPNTEICGIRVVSKIKE
ncbi:MAG TPA: cyclic pyranopterin monophosphate synthase MoaC [Methanothermococcus okinawensis]|uniref:Probable cyclic pyranopterin monophosphate synthase n=1 Tax=Methanothermococcus okinawensis TaxID=155863 RepID=A0A833E1T9_9EURY|nr:cyclic pyranopterin monophosphate synthase MoaC [Methanococcaceae archaeon]HIP84562.1 cyclic pyranopterin monophosphate synthase MoaC [Methanothermococcus okinawensis]HIP90818.1 cyclic pyranopterin monophosphate synthase MoaC [Methanothermococcus okinawensis]